jgi:hypothetical protein
LRRVGAGPLSKPTSTTNGIGNESWGIQDVARSAGFKSEPFQVEKLCMPFNLQ